MRGFKSKGNVQHKGYKKLDLQKEPKKEEKEEDDDEGSLNTKNTFCFLFPNWFRQPYIILHKNKILKNINNFK